MVTPGPASFSVTMLGWASKGRAIGRAGARPGDLVFVTGTIGDGVLGLMAAQGRVTLAPERMSALVGHYRTPVPRVDFAPAVRDLATASVDVSDGLIADLEHVARASGVRVEIDLEPTPLSMAAQVWFEGRVDAEAALSMLATGGDDYEIALTCRPEAEAALRREADRLHLRITRMGQVVAGQGIVARYGGRALEPGQGGWRHR